MLCSDGTLLELVRFKKHNEGPDELTDEETGQVGWKPPGGLQGLLGRPNRKASDDAKDTNCQYAFH